MRVDGVHLYSLIDTPGFQRARKVLAWLEEQARQTRASAAVGVAISVTTIPASAYIGVALGNGELDAADGAAVVLAVNVAMLLTSGSLTLLAQRFVAGRATQRG